MPPLLEKELVPSGSKPEPAPMETTVASKDRIVITAHVALGDFSPPPIACGGPRGPSGAAGRGATRRDWPADTAAGAEHPEARREAGLSAADDLLTLDPYLPLISGPPPQTSLGYLY